MSDPQPRPGRHLAAPVPRPPWDVLAEIRATSGSTGAGREVPPDPDGDQDPGTVARTRISRLWSEVFDRLPAAGQRVAVDLGRHWWLPVLAALAALLLTVGVAVRSRPIAEAAVARGATRSATAAPSASSAPATTAAPTPSLSLLASPTPTAAGPAATPIGTAPSGVPAAATVVSQVVVDIAGRVRHPGVVRLAAGARIVDAIRAAGGALPHTDLTPLDLAQPLTDGEQVRVGLPGPAVVAATAGTGPSSTAAGTTADPGAGGGSADTGAGTTAAPVDINTATATELDALPGIGPVLAGRIIDWRTAHGAFATVDSLEDVPGIGPASLERLRDLVTVGP